MGQINTNNKLIDMNRVKACEDLTERNPRRAAVFRCSFAKVRMD